MENRLGNCVVTGAIRDGYGEAVMRRLITDGYRVFGTYDEGEISKVPQLTSEFPQLILSRVDLASRQSLREFVDSLPQEPFHGLVNAGFLFNMENPDAPDFDAWDRSLAVNLSTPNFLIHAMKPRLADHAGIVTVTSTEGFVGSFGASAYAASKAAVHNLTKTHANILGRRGIRVNAVAAGWIGGVMDTDEVFNRSRDITPLGRLGRPEEIAAVVAFLLSKESSFVTGSVITADGGYSGVDTIAKFEFESQK